MRYLCSPWFAFLVGTASCSSAPAPNITGTTQATGDDDNRPGPRLLRVKDFAFRYYRLLPSPNGDCDGQATHVLFNPQDQRLVVTRQPVPLPENSVFEFYRSMDVGGVAFTLYTDRNPEENLKQQADLFFTAARSNPCIVLPDENPEGGDLNVVAKLLEGDRVAREEEVRARPVAMGLTSLQGSVFVCVDAAKNLRAFPKYLFVPMTRMPASLSVFLRLYNISNDAAITANHETEEETLSAGTSHLFSLDYDRPELGHNLSVEIAFGDHKYEASVVVVRPL